MWRKWGFRMYQEGSYGASSERHKRQTHPVLTEPTFHILHLQRKVGSIWRSTGQCSGITDVFDVPWVSVRDVSKHPVTHRIALTIRKDGASRRCSMTLTLLQTVMKPPVNSQTHLVCAHHLTLSCFLWLPVTLIPGSTKFGDEPMVVWPSSICQWVFSNL